MTLDLRPGGEPAYQVRRRAATSQRTLRHGGSTYTQAEILDAIRRWTTRYGEPPAMIDWDPSRARRQGADWRAERFESGVWPSARMVRGRFSTFNAAIQAAGFTPRRRPTRVRPNLEDPHAVLDAMVQWTRRYGDVPTMADWDPVRARRLNQNWRIERYNQGDWPSARTVAHHFGSFSRAIKEAGLMPRPPASGRADRRESQAVNRRRVAEVVAAETADPGIKDIAASLKMLAAARSDADPVALHVALVDLAASALAWAAVLAAES